MFRVKILQAIAWILRVRLTPKVNQPQINAMKVWAYSEYEKIKNKTSVLAKSSRDRVIRIVEADKALRKETY